MHRLFRVEYNIFYLRKVLKMQARYYQRINLDALTVFIIHV